MTECDIRLLHGATANEEECIFFWFWGRKARNCVNGDERTQMCLGILLWSAGRVKVVKGGGDEAKMLEVSLVGSEKLDTGGGKAE